MKFQKFKLPAKHNNRQSVVIKWAENNEAIKELSQWRMAIRRVSAVRPTGRQCFGIPFKYVTVLKVISL